MANNETLPQNCLEIRYKFKYAEGKTVEFPVKINRKDIKYIPNPSDKDYRWTELEFEKCSHCSLNKDDHPHCPIARNLATLVDHFKNEPSFQVVTVEVATEDRNYSRQASVQEGLYAIFGLIMATSGCPHMDFLRPMALFHLPLASSDETIVRSTAFYLLRQYFVQKNGGTPDWHLDHFAELYKNVELINTGIITRLRKMGGMGGDAEPNAIVVLDTFAKLLCMEIGVNLDSVGELFNMK